MNFQRPTLADSPSAVRGIERRMELHRPSEYGACYFVGVDVVDVVLVALRLPVSDEVARKWWNGKESALDDMIIDCPRLWLGQCDLRSVGEPYRHDPAGRISGLLFLRGTIQEYRLPQLDMPLSSEIMTALQPRPDDLPLSVAAESDVREFLDNHSGWYLVTE
ncbi:hypothetical protein ACIP5Y_46830 [Nocardia sp. NPDC088792]|uniref:hypothetical protein n=1 Tax=Nocardia sp. NPDC088792 TaxID=3364332 RepID=UPI0038099CFB